MFGSLNIRLVWVAKLVFINCTAYVTVCYSLCNSYLSLYLTTLQKVNCGSSTTSL